MEKAEFYVGTNTRIKFTALRKSTYNLHIASRDLIRNSPLEDLAYSVYGLSLY